MSLSANQARPDSSDDMIRKLKAELENSKSVQTELSTDTANLQSGFRKSLSRNSEPSVKSSRESEMMVDELEKTKDPLWSTADGRLPSADTVSKQITQLQSDLEATRGDLRQSRQSLLLEQELIQFNDSVDNFRVGTHWSTIGSGSSRCGHPPERILQIVNVGKRTSPNKEELADGLKRSSRRGFRNLS